PEYLKDGSPTRKVGARVPERSRKVRHASPMLSLESVNDEEGARRFDASCRKLISGEIEYMCEPKLDGLSIELVYEKGVFISGSTRGDGIEGEDVTDNLRTIPSIPKTLKGDKIPLRLAVRGEVIMPIKDFLKLNEKRIKDGKEPYANPRNVAAGTLRQLNPEITAERKLEVYCYRVLDISGEEPRSQTEALGLMCGMGFKAVPGEAVCGNIDKAIEYHHRMEDGREELNYEIDGVVIKVNDIELQNLLGVRTTNPKWAVAYKFRARKEITKVENIVVQVGRTGVVTPLALLTPVDVGGVTVSRATLHNMDRIDKLGIRIGDIVKVERAGDVIPYVSEVVTARRTGGEKKFSMPVKCPSCGTFLEKEDVFYRCPAGLTCPAQIKEAICHYSSPKAADIEGFSDKTAELLYEKGIVKRISDIYAIKKEDLLGLDGWKEKKTENLINAIEKSKEISLDRFIAALGIRNVGRHIARVLAESFGELEKIMASDIEKLTGIREIGPETAAHIVNFFRTEKNRMEIRELIIRGVKVSAHEKKVSGKLSGKKIVFTGSLSCMSRDEARKKAEAEGARVLSAVSADTDIVVAGEEAGSKLKKAEKLGITVIEEKEFEEMLR
ncbi:MAG: NAD-dependent DNA ligase LigA, partial [Candidatus Omnitrophota bacterium]